MPLWLIGFFCLAFLLLALGMIAYNYYGRIWFESYIGHAPVPFPAIVAMSIRRENPRRVVRAHVAATKADLGIDLEDLARASKAGCDILAAVHTMAEAKRHGRAMTFDEACAAPQSGMNSSK